VVPHVLHLDYGGNPATFFRHGSFELMLRKRNILDPRPCPRPANVASFSPRFLGSSRCNGRRPPMRGMAVALERNRHWPRSLFAPPSPAAMLRSVLTVALVASLAAWIAQAERRGAESAPLARAATAATPQSAWVRTADGWQPRGVLAVEPPARAPIHPGLIAGFQLAFSLLVLIAFPGKAKPVAVSRSAPQVPAGVTSKPAVKSALKRRRRISRPVSA
jgi:hypothetical protein